MNSCIMVLSSLLISLCNKNQVGTDLLPRLASFDHKKSGQVISRPGTWWPFEGRRVLGTFAGTTATQGKGKN